MAEYSTMVRIADITIRFESDLCSDISDLDAVLKYHHADSRQETDCTVVLVRQASFRMPRDAKMLWQSNCEDLSSPKGRLGRRRVRVPSRFDTFGVASCYMSHERGEYYYGLMRDKTWIRSNREGKRIDYILHRPPERKGGPPVGTPSPLSAIPLLIHVIMTFQGRYLVHGAAVAVKGKACLLLGKSGSGKSTLSTELAKRGALFMGDDLVLVYVKDNQPMVGSVLLPAKLKVGGAAEKSDVDVPDKMHAAYCTSAPLGSVYSVRLSGLPSSTVEARPSAELLERLMEASNGMVMQYDKHHWIDTMYDISERVSYFVFNYGNSGSVLLEKL